MYFYNDWAKQIMLGRFTDHLAFYGLPLYAYLLAFLYKIFGYNPFVPGFLQICFDSGTATLLYKIAIRVFRKNRDPEAVDHRATAIGVLAALVWTLLVPAQAYSVALMPTTIGVFVFWLLVWQLVKTERAPTPLQGLAFGTLIGVTAMGVATILFLAPLLLAAIAFRSQSEVSTHRNWTAKIAAAAMLLIGIGAGTAPCWIHNCFVARDPVFLSAHNGINFWLGNNPEATGYPHFPGLHASQAAMLKDSIDIAEAATGRRLKRSEVSLFWSEKAREYIAGNFGGWFAILGKKFVNFWNAFEYDDVNIIAKLSGGGVIPPGLHFGLIAVLAIPGICLSIRPFPSTRWIVAAILLHLAAILPVFVTERYRLAAVPGLTLFAAAGLCLLWNDFRQGHHAKVFSYFAVLVISSLFVTWPQRDPALWALKYFNSGLESLASQRWPEAQQQLELAHAYAPDNAEVNLALGNLWLEQKDLSQAKSYYQAVLSADSSHKAALNNLSVVALSEEQWESAVSYLHTALAIDPNDAKSHYLNARAHLGVGNLEVALSEIQIARRLTPGQREFDEVYELIQKRH